MICNRKSAAIKSIGRGFFSFIELAVQSSLLFGVHSAIFNPKSDLSRRETDLRLAVVNRSGN